MSTCGRPGVSAPAGRSCRQRMSWTVAMPWAVASAMTLCASAGAQQPSEPRPASNVRMAERLEAIAASTLSLFGNQHHNAARLEALLAMPPAADPGRPADVRGIGSRGDAEGGPDEGRDCRVRAARRAARRPRRPPAARPPGGLSRGDAPLARHRLPPARPARELPAAEPPGAVRRSPRAPPGPIRSRRRCAGRSSSTSGSRPTIRRTVGRGGG